jgi:hypothetical protein
MPKRKTEASEEAAGAAGPVLHANLTLIEVADPILLAEIRADPRVAPLIATALSDRVAVVRPGAREQVVRQLLKSGHTPRVTEH